MKTILDIPDDLASEVQRRALAGGRDVAAEVVELVRMGLGVVADPDAHGDATITTDPDTGLPVISSPSDAPISRMTSDQILQLMHKLDEEQDLEQFARSLRR